MLNLGFLSGLMNLDDWVVLMVLGDYDEFGFDDWIWFIVLHSSC